MYFQKKQNWRIDRLVFTLLKIAQDLNFEGLQKDETGKRTHQKFEIQRHCQTAMKMKGVTATPLSFSTLTSENTWDVIVLQVVFSILCIYPRNSVNVSQLRCPTCGACVHMYVCSCVDHVV